MIRVLTDHDFDGRTITGLLLRRPTFDLVRAQDVGLAAVPDPVLLAWAAADDRILVTHDRQTMSGHAIARVVAGQPMPGVFVVDRLATAGRVIDDLIMIDDIIPHADWADQIEYLPY